MGGISGVFPLPKFPPGGNLGAETPENPKDLRKRETAETDQI